MDELPEGWAAGTLGEISLVTMGQSPPGHTYNKTGAGLPFFQGKVDFGRNSPTPRVWCTAPSKIAEAGDVLVCVRAPVGPTNLADTRCCIGRGLASVRGLGGIPPEFLRHYLESRRPDLEEAATGSTFTAITGSVLRNLEVPVPPLAEQKRIVEKVEALLAQVQAARDRLERVQQILKRFRQAVLAAACVGDLTADWRERHAGEESGADLLSAILDKRQSMPTGPSGRRMGSTPILEPVAEELPDLPASWAWTTIDALSTKVVDGVHRTPEYQKSGVPFVTVRNLTAGPGIDFENLKYIRVSDHDEFIRRANPERGDLLISKDGTLGVVRAVRTDAAFSIFVSVALVKPVCREMTDFLELVLSSPPVQQRLVPTGSGLQHLHLRDLKASPVPLPPAEEQVEIVRRARRLLSMADAIAGRVSLALARAAATPHAILAKAFAGDLVPTEAELARAEGREYELGEELLQRLLISEQPRGL